MLNSTCFGDMLPTKPFGKSVSLATENGTPVSTKITDACAKEAASHFSDLQALPPVPK